MKITIRGDKQITITKTGNFEIDIEGPELDVRDEYHSMHELYEHRMALNVALFNVLAQEIMWDNAEHDRDIRVFKSKLHHDGTMFDGGYFIVMAIIQGVGQVSYHYKLKHWDLFRIPEIERTPEYDGHKPWNVLERLIMI